MTAVATLTSVLIRMDDSAVVVTLIATTAVAEICRFPVITDTDNMANTMNSETSECHRWTGGTLARWGGAVLIR